MMIPRRYRMLLLIILCLAAACSELREIRPVDRQYLFLSEEIEPYPFAGYRHKTARDGLDYLLFTKLDQAGFRAVYATILISPQGREVNF